jgi:hypothetical protein
VKKKKRRKKPAGYQTGPFHDGSNQGSFRPNIALTNWGPTTGIDVNNQALESGIKSALLEGLAHAYPTLQTLTDDAAQCGLTEKILAWHH